MIARPAYSSPENGQPRPTISAATGATTSRTIAAVTDSGSHGSGAYAPMPPVLGPASSSPTRLKSCAGSSGTTVRAVDETEQRHLGSVEERLQQHRVAVVEQCGGVRAGGVTVGGDHHTLAGRQTVVLDHPGVLPGRRAEAVQRGVEPGRVVDDLASRGAHSGGGHHVFGERFGSLDTGGRGRRPEAGDAGGAHGVGHTAHQWHLPDR